MWAGGVVELDEGVELVPEGVDGIDGFEGGEVAFEGVLEAFDFPATWASSFRRRFLRVRGLRSGPGASGRGEDRLVERASQPCLEGVDRPSLVVDEAQVGFDAPQHHRCPDQLVEADVGA